MNKHMDEQQRQRSSLQVTEGSARMLVTATGLDSEWGKTLALVVCESPDTPLQEKLSDLAGSIGKIGAVVALVTFIVLLVRCGRALSDRHRADNTCPQVVHLLPRVSPARV